MTLRSRALVVVALALALAAPGAGARSAAGIQVVGGTWISGSGTLLGPAWWIDAASPSLGAQVRGPGGYSRHIGGPEQRYPGMPATRSILWCDSCNVQAPGGAWSADGDDGSKAAFSIDQNSRLTPVVLSRTGFATGPQTVSAAWSAGADAGSFFAAVQPQQATGATQWTTGTILPAEARSVTFTDLTLDPKVGYSLILFGFSADIAGTTPPNVFNVASSRIDFLPGQPIRIVPSCYGCVHPHGPPSDWIRFPLRGTLAGKLGATGDATLTVKGKPVSMLASGRYKLTISDRDPAAAFVLQAAKGKLKKLSGLKFVGRRTVGVLLTPGEWTFQSTRGEPQGFLVVGVSHGAAGRL